MMDLGLCNFTVSPSDYPFSIYPTPSCRLVDTKCSALPFLVLCSSFLFYYCEKVNTVTKTKLGEERVYFIVQSQVSSSLGKSGQGRQQKPRRMLLSHPCPLSLAPWLMLSSFFPTTWDHLPREGASFLG